MFQILITLFDACFLGVAIFVLDSKWGLPDTFILSLVMALFVHLPVYLMIDALRYRFRWPAWSILPAALGLSIVFPLLGWLTDPAGGFTAMKDIVFFSVCMIFLPSLPLGLPLTLNYYWERGRRPIGRRRVPVEETNPRSTS